MINSRAKSSKKPTTKRKNLIVELANPENKSIAEAARKAGYAESSVRSAVYTYAKDPLISEAVQKRRQRALAHYQVTPEEVLGAAVFQMRSSMRDILDDGGSFDFDKACETGVVDLLKKHKETKKVTYDPATRQTETTTIIEVELLSNQDGRKEVANYIGLETFQTKADLSPTAFKLLEKAIANGAPKNEAIDYICDLMGIGREVFDV